MPNNESTHAAAEATAKHLADWDYVRGPHGQALLASGHRRIHFCDMPGVAKAGRIDISPILPTYASADRFVDLPHGLKVPAITVAASRSPKAIAQAIKSRLLPDATAAFEAAEAHVARYDAYYASKSDACKAVADAGHGTAYTDHNGEADVRLDLPEDVYGDFKPSSDNSHGLNLSGLSMDKVLAILAIVRSK